MRWLKESTAVDVPIGPFLDSTDGVTAETGLTITQPDIRLKKNGGAWAQKSAAQTLSHEENGFYECALSTTDTGTLGLLRLACVKAGALPIWEDFLVVPGYIYDWFVADTATINVNTASLTAGAITSAAFGAGAIDAAAIAADAITDAKVASDVTIASVTGAVGSVAGAVGSVTGAVGSVTGSVGSIATGGITTASFAAGAINAAAIAADAITDAKVASDVTIASVTGAVGSVAGAVGSVTGNVGGNVVGTVASVVGAVGSVTGNIGGNVAGSVGSIATGGITTASFAAGAINAAAIAGDAITDAKVAADVTIASVTGAVGSVTGNVTGSVGSLAAQAKADVNAEVVDALNVDAYAEPTGTPPATASLVRKIGQNYKHLRNEITQTATTQTLKNDGGTSDITATVSDDGTTFTRTEWS